jgi:hypothetical protein
VVQAVNVFGRTSAVATNALTATVNTNGFTLFRVMRVPPNWYSAVYPTNVCNAVVLDATIPYQKVVVSASYGITGFSGLLSGAQHVLSLMVSNSAATPILVTNPPSVALFGTLSSNVVSVAAGKKASLSFWVRPSEETNGVNAVQQ